MQAGASETHGGTMTSSPIRVPVTDQLLRPGTRCTPAANPRYPSCRPCSAVWRHWTAPRTMPGRRSKGGSWPRSPSRRARLSSAGFTVDADDKGTARFRAAIQAKAARNVTRTEQATSRRLCGELFNNGNDAVSNSVTMRMLLARCFFRACSRGAPRSADQVMSFVGRASSGQLPT